MKTNKKVMLSIALLMVNSAAFASESFKDKAKKAASNALSKVANSMPTVDGAKQAVANGTAKAVNFVKVNAPTVAGTKQAVVNGASSVVDTVKSHPVATGAIIAGTAVVAGIAGTEKGRKAVKSAKDAVVTGFTSAATKTKAAATAVYDRMPNMPTLRRARVANPTQLAPMTDAAQDGAQDAGNQDNGTLQNTTPVVEQQKQITAQVEALNEAAQTQEAIRENAAEAGRQAAKVASTRSWRSTLSVGFVQTAEDKAQQEIVATLKSIDQVLADYETNYDKYVTVPGTMTKDMLRSGCEWSYGTWVTLMDTIDLGKYVNTAIALELKKLIVLAKVRSMYPKNFSDNNSSEALFINNMMPVYIERGMNVINAYKAQHQVS